MKKLFLLLLAAVAAVTSCSKGGPRTPSEPSSTQVRTKSPGMQAVSVTLGCSGVEASTKTVLVDTLVYWTAADRNIVCVTTDGGTYALTSDEQTQAAVKTFTGEIPEGKTPLYYFYDMNKNSGWGVSLKNGHTLRERLPNDIACWTAGSFPATLNFAIAKAGDTAMKNVHGYFKWANNGSAIRSVKFETLTEGEYLAGWFDVRYDGAEPVTSKFVYNETNPAACSRYVLSSIGHASIPAGKSYYAVVIPGTYHGLLVTVTLDDGTSFGLRTTDTVIVDRGAFIDFGVLPVEAAAIHAGGLTLVPDKQGWEDISASDPFSPNWDNL